MLKKFILNADDFGLSKDLNRAVLEGYQAGLLKSASLVANGEAFDEAIEIIKNQCQELGVGIHLNVLEGKSLCSDLTTLTDSDNKFNNSFLQLFIKAYNTKEKDFYTQLEREFRRQIETILSRTAVSHIDSHSHIHSIPKIFDMVCRLAKEYGIKQVRTHFEKPYIIPDFNKHLTWRYPKNILKTLMLGFFTIFNEATIHNYELETNDYIVGLIYSTMMEAIAISYGIKAIKYDNITVEGIIHPCRYEDGTINSHFDEFLLTKNKKLKDKIEQLGFEITNYVKKET